MTGREDTILPSLEVDELEKHLARYLKRVREGERFSIVLNGEVIAELALPIHSQGQDEDPLLSDDPDVPEGLRELVRRGTARRIVRNNPNHYKEPRKPALAGTGTTAAELLDWVRGER